MLRPRVRSSLMPLTYFIIPQGTQKHLTWCQPFGILGLPKSGNPDSWNTKKGDLEVFFGPNLFARPNGQLLPKACPNFLKAIVRVNFDI